ncbi:Uncharacterised protein [Mycolicibacterium phlei]|uniref:DUF6985 domain-containing protein n=1 Tax=Mycobacteroides chelonae TaxID=1774 RepID=UPI000618D0CF|nr:hypothetical protein [Mycobacteroides chelonae]VEG19475.1 Uncharacterised protein [Mycolicibacterium phlei]AKC40107.1 hypothetical protein GR01_18205 [Mycobacteroides chelonae]ANA99703.1 hypothetical protein BB28_19115 [Mycobacteroides chelonae CCUG 47445]OLT82481.1 hypothetical protein BKG56_10555 [Mycobacteroides chelonae]ORV16047.1 hypothetical protein AWB96_08650 [Mycobacteroides chelonae]
MIDPVLGEIAYTSSVGWAGTYTYPFLGTDVTVALELGGDEGEPVDPIQRDAVQRFTENKASLSAQADSAIFAYYNERLPELREQFGDNADSLMPVLTDPSDLARLVKPTAFFVREPVVSDDRVIGLLSTCTWDPGHGLAVKIVNEKIVEVGPQDIVL